ncbi:zinc ribbon domain-containing protein [Candidatus Woesearchaeota archaeon]|nr:zinc ribbon domain-containing protein [Candidatus Woesearchaeota archaeon]
MNPLGIIIKIIRNFSAAIIFLVGLIILFSGIVLSLTVIGLIIGVPLIIIGIFIVILSIFVRGGKFKHTGNKKPQVIVFCKNCKNSNTQSSRFCSKCGKEL